MANTSKETLYEIYEATKLILEDPENMATYAVYGIGPSVVHQTMLENKFSNSTISVGMKQLKEEGYLKELPESVRTRRKYLLTNKVFPSPGPTVPEENLEKDINTLIDNLENIQDVLPNVLAGLLDFSKNVRKYRKVKVLLSNLSTMSRENI